MKYIASNTSPNLNVKINISRPMDGLINENIKDIIAHQNPNRPQFDLLIFISVILIFLLLGNCHR